MTPVVATRPQHGAPGADEEAHVLVVINSVRSRYAVAELLQDAGLRVTTATSFGVVELLSDSKMAFDVLVTAQSFGEMGQFGLPQLARSVQPELPILVLEREAAGGFGVVNAVRDAIRRWPLRARPTRQVH